MRNTILNGYRGWINSAGFLLVVILTFILTISAFGRQPGDLDPTFDNDGWREDTTVPGGGYDRGQVVLVQTDGKIVTVGVSDDGYTACSVTRHLADGTLDASFGNGGKIFGPFGGGSCEPGSFMAVRLQGDDKIVFVERGFLARLNSDGSLDTSFGDNGKVFTGGFYTSMAIQGDGKIVVAGSYAYNCDEKGCYNTGFALARFNSDGSQDNSYGNVQTPVGSYSYADAVAIQPDGKAVAAGSWRDTGADSAAIIRYNIDGTLDSSFGTGGIAKPPTSLIRAVTLQPDGKIVAAFVDGVARYTSVGAFDGSFGNAGVITTPPGAAYAVDLQPDGRIIAMASPSIRRYNANGSPDASFGSQGTVTVVNGVANSFTLQSDGKIVAGGYHDNGTNDDFFLTRYNPDGSADIGGFNRIFVTTDIGSRHLSWGSEVAIQTDGKIVVAGVAINPHPRLEDPPGSPTDFRQFAVLRYNPDGSLDNTFGGDGKVTTAFGAFTSEAEAIGVQPDGKIVVTGFAYAQTPGRFDWAIARYNQDGSLDSTFSDDGKLTLSPNPYSGSATALVVRANGKLIIGGGSGGGFTIIRLNADSSLDGSFGSGGIVSTAIGPGSEIRAISIDAAGRIVGAGSTYDGSNGSADFALARYNPNGLLDTTFDSDGIVTTSFGAQLQFGHALSIQSDGKIVAAGWVRNDFPGYDNFAVARYNPDGSLDTSFDGDGKVVTDSGNIFDTGYAVSVQHDGKIIVVGHPGLMVRYTSNGALDASFGNGGIKQLGGNYLSGMVIDSSNRAVIVGSGLYIARVLLAAKQAPFDFDGDGRSDLSVFRPSDRVWYIDRSTEGFTALQFGLSTDRIVPADYDGDGKTDIAIFRDGTWWRINTGDSTVNAVQFGVASDVPVPADYTGDGRAELSVYRNGQWWTHDLSDGISAPTNFGIATDRPAPADYDGDGKTDFAIYRSGAWWRINSGTGGVEVVQFGLASDLPVVGDYDGDSKADLAVYREGAWYLQQSRDGFATFSFGIASDIPAPADYDGDGKTDAAVYRNGVWYVLKSTGGVTIRQFGTAGDKPVPAAYVPE